MQADQAAGLRHQKLLPKNARVVSLYSSQSGWAPQLAKRLEALGSRVLLVDTTGRHAPASKTQSIFGWQTQISRQHLQPVTMAGIDTLHAPGALVGDGAIVQACVRQDYVLFDGGTMSSETLPLDAGPEQTFVVEVSTAPEALCNTYSFIKTLHLNQLNMRVILCGQPAPCERVISATHHFMHTRPVCLECINLAEDAHLTALAAKISSAETGTSRFYNNTGGVGLQHG